LRRNDRPWSDFRLVGLKNAAVRGTAALLSAQTFNLFIELIL
jgi:hypothetical protein